MSTLRSILTRLMRGTSWLPGARGNLPPSPSIVEEADVEDALRFTLRAEVAGASPAGDAWGRLQRRLQQESAAGAEIASFPLPVRPQVPAPRPWWLATEILPRFSQLGIAVLLFLLIAGDVNSLDPFVVPSRTPTAIEQSHENVSVLLPGPARLSRLARIEDGFAPTTSATPVNNAAAASPATTAFATDVAVQVPANREELAAIRVGWALRQAPEVQRLSANPAEKPANPAESGSDLGNPLNSDGTPADSTNRFHRAHAQ
ncbi:MAG TPA: hypothetical protein VFM49_02560 [Chloroflexia bacterium]|jgi:hypothetical protein|nr:hypothetical protein [Chloroflexia bacterium]